MMRGQPGKLKLAKVLKNQTPRSRFYTAGIGWHGEKTFLWDPDGPARDVSRTDLPTLLGLDPALDRLIGLILKTGEGPPQDRAHRRCPGLHVLARQRTHVDTRRQAARPRLKHHLT